MDYKEHKIKMNYQRLLERSKKNSLLVPLLQHYENYFKEQEQRQTQLLQLTDYIKSISDVSPSQLNQLEYEYKRIMNYPNWNPLH
jgi:hypothetical protein